MNITHDRLLELGFRKDQYSEDRYEIGQIELSGYDSVGCIDNGDKRIDIKPGQYCVTADCGMIIISRVFSTIEEVSAMIKAIV